jgi:nucleotide-binding universal stress UspA family protein
VRPHDGAAAPEPRIGRVLVPLDLSEYSTAVLDPAAAIAEAWSAELVLYHVVEPMVGIVDGALPFPIPVDASALESRKKQAEQRLAELAEPLRTRGLVVSTRVTVGVSAPQTILDEAPGYDLIAMTTHGERGFRRLIVGSVADKVIRASEPPVLVMRGRESEA